MWSSHAKNAAITTSHLGIPSYWFQSGRLTFEDMQRPLVNAIDGAPLPLAWTAKAGEVTHVFTHFALKLTVYLGAAPQARKAPAGARWVAADAVADEALPSLMRKVAAHAGLEIGPRPGNRSRLP